MKLRYTQQARRDLDSLYHYVAREDPNAAQGVVERMAAMIDHLPEHPALGLRGRMAEVLELVIPNLPFVVVYEVSKKHIDILAIIHKSRRWPDRA
ncbi:MAG TPA: type II toxin-antitoxin system RelE/ParE family toxin [Rhizobiales bacterium]|nr:type II toxin-antitoxin system RelE/ParE family toxin [Hyphomicrobiales bacterium]